MGVDLGVVISIAFDPAVDVDIHRYEGAVGFLLKAHFHTVRFIGMEQQFHLVTDQVHRSFIQFAVEGHGAVFTHPPPGCLPEVIGKVCRCLP